MQHIFSKMRYRQFTILLSLLLAISAAWGQTNVLFIGNSYTDVNNLPQMTADVAASMGSTMTWSSNTPGGCTFSMHCTNQSMTLIQQGGWDFVVLQEQSQNPSFPQSQVEAEVFPFAARLVDSVYAASPCAEPMFYMTWGRKNGDAYNAQFFPVLGTYEGMDSMLYMRYMQMAADNDASVCPVGRVWRYLRKNYPDIELYHSDGSHPSTAGTYAAACSFYVMFFGGDPAHITYVPAALDPHVAETIRDAVRQVVYLQREHWRRTQPQAAMELSGADGNEVTLTAHALYADSLTWDFGDGIATAATDSTVTHTYADSGSYTVTLVALRHCMTDTAVMTITVTGSGVGIDSTPQTPQSALTIYPNPATGKPAVTLDGITPKEVTVTTPDGRTMPYGMLDEADMPSGLYIISVKYAGQLYTGKFIKL